MSGFIQGEDRCWSEKSRSHSIGSYDEAFFDNLGDPDGYDDIVCHFLTAEIVGVPDGTDLPIKVQGDLIGGGKFEGTDLVKVKNSTL